MKSNIWKRNLAVLMAFGVVSGTGIPGTWMMPVTAKAESKITLSNPRIEKDEDMEAGQNVTWDCIYFGSYPQREVVEDADTYQAIDKDYADFEHDAIEDVDLFNELKASDEQEWNEQNEITLHGEKYRRMKRGDATGKGKLIAEEQEYEYKHYYHWDNDTEWHYFKYEPIKWRVLNISEDKALLLSDLVLDDQDNSSDDGGIWKYSDIRSWLNAYGMDENESRKDYANENFIDCAFTQKEQDIILNDMENSSHTEENDKIFLLSDKEMNAADKGKVYGFVEDYFSKSDEDWSDIDDEAKRSRSSTYAKAMGLFSGTIGSALGNCYWFLRLPSGSNGNDAGVIDEAGKFFRSSIEAVKPDAGGIRPALNIDLSTPDLWTYAGTTNSKECVGNIDRTLENGLECTIHVQEKYVEITGYSGKEKELEIPQTIEGITVTEIYSRAFNGCESLEKIILPEGLTDIGEYAFLDCSSLKTVILPSTLEKIGLGSFSDCEKLSDITFPEGTLRIGDYSFARCPRLEQIYIPSSVEYVGGNPFSECANLESITVATNNPVYDSRNNSNAIIETENNQLVTGCRNTVIPENIESIGLYAFSGCDGLTAIDLPENLQEIDGGAFEDCINISSLYIPENVRKIGYYAFQGCSGLENITVAKENPVYDSRNNCNAIIDTKNMKLIAGCNTSKIPSDISSISYGAFYGCKDIKSIEIPKSVTNIESGAFQGCSGIEYLTVDSENPVYDSRSNCNAIIEKESNTLIVGCKTTKILSSVEVIGRNAFANCSDLESIVIPDSVTKMGYWAFSGCSGLKQIKLSKNLKSVTMDCFSECSALENIVIPEGITQLAAGAFMHCTNLKKIELPSTLEGIYEHAFARCINLTQITIPAKVKVIAYGAFVGCDNLKDIYYPGTKEQWDAIKIVENDNDILKTATIHYGFTEPSKPTEPEPSNPEPSNPQPSNPSVPDNSSENNSVSVIKQGDVVTVQNAKYRITGTGTAKTAEYKKSDLKTQATVKIPATVTINKEVYKVTSIAKNCFKGNKKLKTITISKNIKTIGANAFSGCKNLKTIKITSTSLTKKTVGKNAFKGIYKKAVIKVPKKKLKSYQKILKGKGQAKSVKIKK